MIGLLVPGLWNPLIGLPALDMGLITYEIPPGYPADVRGRLKDVPGLGALFIALSSISRSATPSSSISRSSTQLFFVRALHLSNHAAYSYNELK